MWRGVIKYLMAIVMMMVSVGCNNEEEAVDSQRQNIIRFLTSTHEPRLISQSEIENSLESEPPFYERLDYNVYRYIATYYDPERDSRKEIKWGDKVELTYVGFRFTGSKFTLGDVYSTNDESTLAQLEEAGLDGQYWATEPLLIVFGQGNIIKGVETSLNGCREGDVVEVYMTYEAAYDKHVVGVVPKDSAIAWIYSIDKVN